MEFILHILMVKCQIFANLIGIIDDIEVSSGLPLIAVHYTCFSIHHRAIMPTTVSCYISKTETSARYRF